MQTRSNLTKNLCTSGGAIEFRSENQNAVFISYKREPDKEIAYECAKILQDTSGLYYWIDEEHAEAKGSDIDITLCIEKGLDATSALLGIIGPQTLDSAWIPYEIGGARGRQRFRRRFDKETLSAEQPHPLIAHLIHGQEITDLPGFIQLGTPLRCLCEVQEWAAYIAEVLREENLSLQMVKSIRQRSGIQEIYERNIRLLTWK